MESAFGTDFSQVRIHTNSTAIQMNKELNAQAFTHGSDIYFNSGKYDPSSSSGQHLLAHELTHTVQQGGIGNRVHRKVGEKESETALGGKAKEDRSGWVHYGTKDIVEKMLKMDYEKVRKAFWEVNGDIYDKW